MTIPIYKPHLTQRSRDYLIDAYDSGWISSTGGKYLELVENKLKDMLGIKYVVLTDNGTTACHLTARSLKEFGRVTDIIVPNNVYVAAWNAFLFENEFNIMNTDTDKTTWQMDKESLDLLQYKANAALIVHNLGGMVNISQMKRDYPNIRYYVEDACEAFGGKYENKNVGSESLSASLSFYANKNVTCGEGGALITNNEDVYHYAKLLCWQGQSQRKFVHHTLGYNYRMTNIQASLLLGQLESYDEIMEMKYRILSRYLDGLRGLVPFIHFQLDSENTTSVFWMFGLRFLGQQDYTMAEEYFKKRHIETRPFFYPINRHGYLKHIWRNNINAELLSREIVIFPSYPDLVESDQDYIIKTIKEYVKEFFV